LGILAEIVNTEKELKNHLRSISEISRIALIQEVICLPEYRIFAVDGEVKFVYERLAAKIVGDGQTPILEYIAQMNQHIKRDRNKISEASVFVKHQLEKNGLSLDSVLKKGQELPVASKANISAGGQIKNYSKTVSAETSKWVKSIMKDMSLRVCGIDVFVEKSIDDPKGFIVIEINHNPNFSGIYELGHKDEVLKIWGEILEKHFSST
jgi:cyanophycin synthetase